MASVWDCGDAVWHDSLNAIVSAFAAFLAAGLRPRTTLAKAIMLVLIIKLIAIGGIGLVMNADHGRPVADSIAMSQLIGPMSPSKGPGR